MPILRAHNRQPRDQTQGSGPSAGFHQSRWERSSRPYWRPCKTTGCKPSARQNPCRITSSNRGLANRVKAPETCDTQARLEHEQGAGMRLPAVYLRTEWELGGRARRLLASRARVLRSSTLARAASRLTWKSLGGEGTRERVLLGGEVPERAWRPTASCSGAVLCVGSTRVVVGVDRVGSPSPTIIHHRDSNWQHGQGRIAILCRVVAPEQHKLRSASIRELADVMRGRWKSVTASAMPGWPAPPQPSADRLQPSGRLALGMIITPGDGAPGHGLEQQGSATLRSASRSPRREYPNTPRGRPRRRSRFRAAADVRLPVR